MPWNIPVEDVNFAVKNPLLAGGGSGKSSPSDVAYKNSVMGWMGGPRKWSEGSTGMEDMLGLGFFNSIPAQYQVSGGLVC